MRVLLLDEAWSQDVTVRGSQEGREGALVSALIYLHIYTFFSLLLFSINTPMIYIITFFMTVVAN